MDIKEIKLSELKQKIHMFKEKDRIKTISDQYDRVCRLWKKKQINKKKACDMIEKLDRKFQAIKENNYEKSK